MRRARVLSKEAKALLTVCRRAILSTIACCALAFWPDALARGAAFRHGFDGEKPSWSVAEGQPDSLKKVRQDRTTEDFVNGGRSERIAFQNSSRDVVPVELTLPLPQALVIEDLKLALSVKSNAGSSLFLRVRFPHETDPRTGEPLSMLVRGSASMAEPGEWGSLECLTSEKPMQDALRRLNFQIQDPSLVTRDPYVDAAVLLVDVAPGTTTVLIDELLMTGFVERRTDGVLAEGADEASRKSAAELALGRMTVEGRPFFPRIMPYHQEDLEGLAEMGVNVLWIPRSDDGTLIAEIRRRGIWPTATPPRAVDRNGAVLTSREAGVLPFLEDTRDILFWTMGSHVPAESERDLADWIEQVRAADVQQHRPIAVDVIQMERTLSREVPSIMLGSSRDNLHSHLSFKDGRDWQIQRRRQAFPGSYGWSWIQTEPDPELVALRTATGSRDAIVIEPEQIWMETHSALASGCKGIGYWKTQSFDRDTPGGYETRLAITLNNLRLQILEPWLATGTVQGQVPFTIDSPQVQPITQRSLPMGRSLSQQRARDAKIREYEEQQRQAQQLGAELEATVIRCDFGVLLLPAWYQSDSQFVPGGMVARNATVIVPPPFSQSAQAWEVTTTRVRSLHRERVAGGMKITLPQVDQTAAVILMPPDERVSSELFAEVRRVAEKAARVSVDLSRAKLKRVEQIHERIMAAHADPPRDGPQFLQSARSCQERAETALSRGDFNSARLDASNAMQSLRMLQRIHFADAMHKLTSPTSSPHTLCFSTLADHWDMVARLGRAPRSEQPNLLPSGDFEIADTRKLRADGWDLSRSDVKGVFSKAELHKVGHSGQYSLRLLAVPDTSNDAPVLIEQPPVTMATPEIEVQQGDLIHISGWVQVTAPIVGSLDGVTLHDSLGGPKLGLRWTESGDWQRFEMIREAPADTTLRLTLTLWGMGVAQFDDLQVVAVSIPKAIELTDGAEAAPENEPRRTNPLRLLNPLRGQGKRETVREPNEAR